MISVENVTKSYGAFTAVRDVSFQVRKDEIVGFLGPNGAGKTTLLRMLATYLLPTRGRITVAGKDAVEDPLAVRRAIGYLSGDSPLYMGMRVDKFLRFLGSVRQLPPERLEQRFAWAVDAFGLKPVLGNRIYQCSLGFRQRVALAGALLHDPEVVLLDEPTQSFDPLQVLAFRDMLKAYAKGKAVLFSSHVIPEVAATCDRVLILHQGHLLGDGSLEDLARAAGTPKGDLEAVFAGLVRRYESTR